MALVYRSVSPMIFDGLPCVILSEPGFLGRQP
jgi:hypothetical protein